MTKPGDPDDPFNEPTVPVSEPTVPSGPEQPSVPGPGPGPGPQSGGQLPPMYGAYGQNPQAPYGYHPVTGVPFSDKSKLIAGLLQILVPIGIGRFYIGDISTGIWQLVVTILTCGIGAIWPFIDGILMLVGNVTDPQGRPLRDGT